MLLMLAEACVSGFSEGSNIKNELMEFQILIGSEAFALISDYYVMMLN